MTKILAYLQGKKTYITAAAMIAYAIIGWVLQLMTPDAAIHLVFAALALIGIRSGLETEVQKIIDAAGNPVIVTRQIDLSSQTPVTPTKDNPLPPPAELG